MEFKVPCNTPGETANLVVFVENYSTVLFMGDTPISTGHQFKTVWQALKPKPKSPPAPPLPLFTEQDISDRAHQIWQARIAQEKPGTPEKDWQMAIESLEIEHALPKELRSIWLQPQPLEAQKTAIDIQKLQIENRKIRQEWFKIGVSVLGLGATIVAGIGLLLNYYQGSERLVTERYGKAVEQLGNEDISVRIGGVYALERIAKDSPKDHWTIMEVLTAFVRERSLQQTKSSTNRLREVQVESTQGKRLQKEVLKPITTDVQSALTVIGRRITENDPGKKSIDLKRANLVGADFIRAKLNKANLIDANLNGAKLNKANLIDANLNGAKLNKANLIDANLSGANLSGAKLNEANLSGINLSGVNLNEANLSGAKLNEANLSGAKLNGANLSDVNLLGANLLNANFSNANLSGATVTDMELKEALLCKTILMGGKTRTDRDCERLKKAGIRVNLGD